MTKRPRKFIVGKHRTELSYDFVTRSFDANILSHIKFFEQMKLAVQLDGSTNKPSFAWLHCIYRLQNGCQGLLPLVLRILDAHFRADRLINKQMKD